MSYNILGMKKIDSEWKEGNDKPGGALSILLLPLTIPHELSHYLIGRLFGVNISLGLYRVTYSIRNVPMWKRILIDVAPTILSLIIFSITLFYLIQSPITKARAYVALFGFTYALMLLSSCVGDWRDIRQYIKSR